MALNFEDIENIAKSLDDKDEFTGYRIKTICGWCKKPLGFVSTPDPKQDGLISHGMCKDCEAEQYRQAGLTPPVTEGLDDVDEFVTKGSYCEHCNELVDEVVPVDPYEPQYSLKVCKPCLEIINQGPQDDKWLKFFEAIEKLDDLDEFHKPDRCERCNGRDYVEQVYFNNTSEMLCRWCAKELFIDISYHLGESIEDADEFGNIKAVAGYEESSVDASKHVFIFEDGARLYQDAKVTDVGVRYRVILKTPDGQTHRTSDMNYGVDDVPAPFSQYWDGMYDFIREEGDIKPFPPELFTEFQQAMTVTESINEAAKGPTLATILNTRGVVPNPATFAPEVPDTGLEGLDDRDEFESRKACAFKGEVRLLDSEGLDITDSLNRGFNDQMSVWIDHSPNWKEHEAWVDFEGNLSTQPPLLGPECVVWVDAPASGQQWKKANGPFLASIEATWYRPEGEWGPGMWMEAHGVVRRYGG